MRERKDRFHGPYKHRAQWRVLVVTADGARGYRYFETEREAEGYVREARLLTESRTVGSEVNSYLQYLREGGARGRPVRPSTLATVECRLKSLLRLREHDTPMSELTPALVEKLYARRCKEVRVDTHRGELTVLSQFCEYLVRERRLLTANPCDGVRPRGEVSTGKTTLYTDEARKFLRVALDENSVDGLACAVVLIFGLRASELVGLRCGDLDADGTILRVCKSGGGKSRAATRNIAIPSEPGVLRSRLKSLRGDRAPADPLFPGMTRYRLHYQVGRLCSAAGVTRVCPHGLRGTALTEAATGSLVVAQRLAGHEIGTRVTERHYIAPGTLEGVEARRRGEILASVTSGVPVGDLAPEVGNERATGSDTQFPSSVGVEVGDLN